MAGMKRFPPAVREAMGSSGAMATCVPVRLDGSSWEAAFFMQLAGAESKEDWRLMARRGQRGEARFAMGLESDVVESEHGAVVILRPELHTRPGDPLVMEILLTPGLGGAHHEALQLLASQASLSWFFADAAYWVLHAQTLPLAPSHHEGFRQLLAQCLRHDTLVRLTGSYDAPAALGTVVRHYELRAAAREGASR